MAAASPGGTGPVPPHPSPGESPGHGGGIDHPRPAGREGADGQVGGGVAHGLPTVAGVGPGPAPGVGGDRSSVACRCSRRGGRGSRQAAARAGAVGEAGGGRRLRGGPGPQGHRGGRGRRPSVEVRIHRGAGSGPDQLHLADAHVGIEQQLRVEGLPEGADRGAGRPQEGGLASGTVDHVADATVGAEAHGHPGGHHHPEAADTHAGRHRGGAGREGHLPEVEGELAHGHPVRPMDLRRRRRVPVLAARPRPAAAPR